ncbi:MAG TPA: hypothetical protein VFG23_23775, partial [Polyangia bacterium]|nr:hypothetical protein [Polyangia bacterium]
MLPNRATPESRAEPLTKRTPPPLARPGARARRLAASALILLALAAVWAALLVGPAHLSAAEVIGAIGRRLVGRPGAVPWRDLIVVRVRLPRALVA